MLDRGVRGRGIVEIRKRKVPCAPGYFSEQQKKWPEFGEGLRWDRA